MKKILSKFLPVVFAFVFLAPTIASAAATFNINATYSITPTIAGFQVDLLGGTASVVNPPGNAGQYGIAVDWGNGTYVPATFAPFATNGNTISSTWTATHLFTAPGSYTIKAIVHHSTPQGNESGAQTITFTAVIPTENCLDEKDNDFDGFVDLEDTDCLPYFPHITLTKTVTNDNGGAKTPANFALFVDSTEVTSGQTIAVTPGAHTVSETNLPGYTAGTWGGDCAVNGTITVAAGLNNNYSCTITNNDIQPKLTVTKIVTNDNGGQKIVSDFTLFVNATTVTSGVQTGFNAGTYTISETTDPNYVATFSGDCDANGSIKLSIGDVKSCTITNNDKASTLTVIKTVKNDNNGTKKVSDFDLFIDGNSVTSGVATNVSVGTHIVTETSDAGYTASAWGGDCDADGNITIAFGENKVCTITNDDKPGSITVIKTVTNNNNGMKDAVDFIINIILNNIPVASFPGNKNGTTVEVNAGDFSVEELVTDGYAQTLSGDCEGEIANGESKTCTIENDDIAPRLTVVKTVKNNNGGKLGVDDFALYVDDTKVISGEENEFSVGNYTVSEDNQDGYEGVFGGDCDVEGNVTLALGDVKTCTITNTDIAPGLTLLKGVTNDNGGEATINDFQASINGEPVAWEVTQILEAGTYTLEETNLPGYEASEWTCDGGTQDDNSITLEVGDSVSCSINNNDIAPSLTLIKEVVNDNNGEAVATDWILAANGPTSISGVSGVASDETFKAGTYTLSETAGPAGYTALEWTCDGGDQNGDSITIGVGENVICTITNDDDQGRLIVKKVVIGGDAEVDDFSFTINDGKSTNFNNDGENEISVDAGTYTVTEVVDPNYTASYENCSEISIANGGTATCTIINTFVPTPVPGCTDQTATNYNPEATVDDESCVYPPTDVCPNIEGAQSQVPEEMHLSDGQCVPNTTPTDVCPNIEGNQETIPDGMTKNNDGQCVKITTPIDVCPNIEGNQLSIPNGMIINDDGSCVEETRRGGGGGGGRRIPPETTSSSTPVGQVLGAETTCGIYLDKYLQKGRKNDSDSVKKVQKFLNDFFKAGLAEDGIFGPKTDASVRQFQWGHKENILYPWKLKAPTGIVYLTTTTEINNIMCPSLDLPIPANLIPASLNPAFPPKI